MMGIRRFIMASLTMLACFLSCEKGREPGGKPYEADPELTVTPSQPDVVEAAGGNIVLNLYSNMDWSVEGVPGWITVSPESGSRSYDQQKVTVTVKENKETAREAVLLFQVQGSTVEIKISQKPGISSVAPGTKLFFESLESSMGSFTIEDVTVPEQLSCVWEHSAEYKCMKGTAYKNPNNYASESWLISPEIDLTSIADSYLTFEHAGGYFGEASKEATVWVSAGGDNWVQLVIEKNNYPTSWTFVNAGHWSLKDFAGSKIRIAFKYYSTATKAGTWEIRNVSVIAGEYQDVVVPNVDPKKTQWLELPAMDDDSYVYHSHSFTMNTNVYRNYSYAWSQKDLVSVWVAYPLCSMYMDEVVKRTDEWAYDPILGNELSSAPFTNYAGDYARGHQLPSADRLCSREANSQTFYGTNIAPQINEHNEGIWSSLESKIRTVASASDTTYVVTGCVVDGATEFSTDSDGKKITIPVAFFKAVLRYKAGDSDVWTAAGFYTEHNKYTSSGLKSVSMTIDELEEKTGLDFFVNLTEKIGADKADAVEAQDPTTYSVWGL